MLARAQLWVRIHNAFRPLARLNFLLAVFLFLSSAGVRAVEPETIELFEYTGTYPLNDPPQDKRPIVLQIPEAFRYGSTKGASRTWGVQILTYYPDFSSPRDLENKNFGLDCAGLCNGRILVSVEFRPRIKETNSPNMADFIARAQLKWKKTPPYPPNVVVRDLGAQSGFDEGFERTTTVSADTRADQSSPKAMTEKILFRRAPDEVHYDLTATCRSALVRTGCILHFSLSCNPAIYVSVHGLDSDYLDRSSDIMKKANVFISAMVKSPTCSK